MGFLTHRICAENPARILGITFSVTPTAIRPISSAENPTISDLATRAASMRRSISPPHENADSKLASECGISASWAETPTRSVCHSGATGDNQPPGAQTVVSRRQSDHSSGVCRLGHFQSQITAPTDYGPANRTVPFFGRLTRIPCYGDCMKPPSV